MLHLHCCALAFFSCGEQGLFFVAVHGLLTEVASLVGGIGSRCKAFSSCGTQASVVVAHGLSSCGLRALERRLNSCGTWA